MVTPFLGLVYKTGSGVTAPVLKRYSAADVNTVGTTFGTFDTATSAQNMPVNRAIRFGGLNTFIATSHNQVLRSTDGGTTWTVVLTTSIDTVNSSGKTGLNIVYINGQPAICAAYRRSGALWDGIFSFDGVVWNTQSSLITAGSSGPSVSSDIVYNNVLYSAYASTGGPDNFIISYDPGSGTMSVGTITGAVTSFGSTFCIFNNRLFGVTPGATDWILFEVVGNIVIIIDSAVIGTTSTEAAGNWAGGFSDGTNMYFMMARSQGNVIIQWDSALTKTNITSTVFPTALSTGSSTGRFGVIADDERTPGSIPDIFVYYSSNGTTAPVNVFQWNGTASVMTLVDVGGSATHALPFNINPTGAYFFEDSTIPSTASTYGEITSRTFTSTGVRLSFKIYGSSSGMNFRAWFGEATDEYPTTAAALSSPTVGTISGGTINTGLTADNGATTYQVTWTPPGTITQNERFRLIGEFFFA